MAHPSPTSPRRQAAIPALLAAFALLLGACSTADRPTLADRAAPTSVTSTTAPSGPTTTQVRLDELPPGPENLLGYIATPLGTEPEVRTAPDPQAERLEIGATTEVGAPTTFAVLGDPGVTSAATNGWYKVLIPTRPNQGTAWVPAASVALTQTPMRVFISLADRTLRVENNGASVFDTTVAIGTDENPTPLGATYITELIQNTNPGGAYGPYAFGLALHSETLTEFAGGPGQVGVHGTNQPDLIGQAVSHGCVRLNNDDIQALVDLQLPLGVPVLIS
ncbi:MAG TPA: L,D-transpeptidase family protein [Acidimicrobiales bacterium]|nr:L,D-transpeptidase family protein [Acidimicrobiales bacterium]